MMEGRNVERPGRQGRLFRDGFDAPKGRKIIAQGFSPGLAFQIMRPESGARIRSCFQSLSRLMGRPASPMSCASREAVLQKCLVRIAPRDREVGDAFRAVHCVDMFPGLKPRAESYCPFGTANLLRRMPGGTLQTIHGAAHSPYGKLSLTTRKPDAQRQ